MENLVSICRLLPPVVAPRYRAASSNATFQLVLGSFSHAAAEAACNDAGGHLTSWSSQQEQFEVKRLTGASSRSCSQQPRCAACALRAACYPSAATLS
jgi:hypothetical protein